ncbi:MraY family glycosyltransferase [Alkaliphilus crotonatoxidans]
MEKYLIAFVVSVTIAYILTPYAIKLAYRIGAIDVPKDNRRVHNKPIPRLGGAAIYASFLVTSLVMAPLSRELLGILVGATIIVFMGMVDDVKPISAKWKLLVQIIASLVVIFSDVRIEYIRGVINLGAFSIPATIFWIVGITNAVNLIDGLDGLAAGVGIIASLSLAFVSFSNVLPGMTEVTLLLVILAGSATGFLPYNFNPAKIFMGDTGALLIGFLLATISVEGVLKSAATIAVVIPVLALGVPVLDTAFAITRRLLNKRPIMEADKGHLHHRLLDLGLSQKQTVLILYLISSFLGASAVFISDVSKKTAYGILVVLALIIAYGAVKFGLIKEGAKNKVNVNVK